MSDDLQNWSEAPAPRRSGPPKWMLYAGCGCLLPGFALVVLVAGALEYFQRVTAPGEAYNSLASMLPFDEALKGRPTGLADDPSTRVIESHDEPEYELLFGSEIKLFGGIAFYCFVRGASEREGEGEWAFADDALIAILAKVPVDQSEDIMQARGDDAESEPFQLDVQGVTLSGVRQADMKSMIRSPLPFKRAKVEGPGVALKLRADVPADPVDPESKLFDILLMLQRPNEDGGPVTDAEIQHFLAPFHIGPAR